MLIVSAWILIIVLLLAYLWLVTRLRASSLGQRPLLLILGGSATAMAGAAIASELCFVFGWESAGAFLHYLSNAAFFTTFVGLALYLPVFLLAWLFGNRLEPSGKRLGPRGLGVMVFIPFFCGALLAGYGLFEASSLQIKQTVIQSSKIPPGQPRIRVVAFADLHLEDPANYGALEDLVALIIDQKPDLILALGDIITGPLSDEPRVSGLLARLQAPLGKFFIYGNHEMYSGRNQPIRVLRDSGFRALINQVITIGNINLMGVSDPVQEDLESGGLPPLISNHLFTILMKHRPLVSAQDKPFFDLQLSGHTHGGQIWPFTYLIAKPYPYLNGLYLVGDEKWLYTSPGVGTYGLPVRLLVPPEITVIDLVPK